MRRQRSKARWDEGRSCYRVQVRWTALDGRIRSEERFGPDPIPLDAWAEQRRQEIDADREAARVRARLEAAGWSLPSPSSAAPTAMPTLLDFSATFLRWLPTSRAAPGTVRGYETHLRLHACRLLGPLRIDEITPARVDYLRHYLDQRGHSVAPVLTALSACLAHAVREGLIDRNPCHRPRGLYRADAAPSAKPPARTVTRSQRQAALDQLPAGTSRLRRRWRWQLRLAAWCGLRLGEIRGLRVADLDLDAGLIHVEQQVQWSPGEGCSSAVRPPKYLSRRLVPLGWRVRDELADAVREAERLGVTLLLADPGRGVPGLGCAKAMGGVHRRVHDAQVAAGVTEPIPWRNWRSTYLTLALEYGYPAALVEQWVGHRGVSVSGLTRIGKGHYLGAWDPATLDRAGLD